MKSQRNDPCPCGSGKKYKNCCAIQRTPSQRLWTVGAALIAVILVGGFGVVFYDATTGEPPAPQAEDGIQVLADKYTKMALQSR